MLAAIEQEGNGLQLEQEQSRETMKWLNAGMEERPRVAVASGAVGMALLEQVVLWWPVER